MSYEAPNSSPTTVRTTKSYEYYNSSSLITFGRSSGCLDDAATCITIIAHHRCADMNPLRLTSPSVL